MVLSLLSITRPVISLDEHFNCDKYPQQIHNPTLPPTRGTLYNERLIVFQYPATRLNYGAKVLHHEHQNLWLMPNKELDVISLKVEKFVVHIGPSMKIQFAEQRKGSFQCKIDGARSDQVTHVKLTTMCYNRDDYQYKRHLLFIS